jgi:hypothetical protein
MDLVKKLETIQQKIYRYDVWPYLLIAQIIIVVDFASNATVEDTTRVANPELSNGPRAFLQYCSP